jgi:hypothetical protein
VDDALVFADPHGRRSHPADDLCCASEQARLLYDGTQGWIQPKIASRSSMGASAPKPREGRPNRCDATWPVPKLTLNRAFHHMLPRRIDLDGCHQPVRPAAEFLFGHLLSLGVPGQKSSAVQVATFATYLPALGQCGDGGIHVETDRGGARWSLYGLVSGLL